MTSRHRTFVKLDDYEKEIVDNLCKILRKSHGKRYHRSTVIKGIIRDYWSRLKEDRITGTKTQGSDGLNSSIKTEG